MTEYKKVSGAGGRWSTAFSCDVGLKNRIVAYCSERGCTKSWLISKALDAYLAEAEEDKADYAIAAAAWKEFEASGEKGITLEDLREKLGV